MNPNVDRDIRQRQGKNDAQAFRCREILDRDSDSDSEIRQRILGTALIPVAVPVAVERASMVNRYGSEERTDE
jgi:hypothetical protein